MAEECGCDLPETLNYGFFRPSTRRESIYSHVLFRIKRIIRETKPKGARERQPISDQVIFWLGKVLNLIDNSKNKNKKAKKGMKSITINWHVQNER